jgi:hypothetical protein
MDVSYCRNPTEVWLDEQRQFLPHSAVLFEGNNGKPIKLNANR